MNYSNIEEKFNDNNILVIGLGTAGSYLVEVLQKLGLGNLYIVDGDEVELDNLYSQNYYDSEIGMKKVDALKHRFPHCKIEKIDRFIHSYDELERFIDVSKIDYVINAADQLEILTSLLSAKKKNRFSAKIIETGYNVLNQSTILIETLRDVEWANEFVQQQSNRCSQWIVENNGSIFNSLFSAYSVVKIIFDDVLNLTDSSIAFNDLLQNEMFLGNTNDLTAYNTFSEFIQSTRMYTGENKSDKWILEITQSTIFQPEVRKERFIFSQHEKEFLMKKFDPSKAESLESFAGLISNKIDAADEQLRCFKSEYIDDFMKCFYDYVDSAFEKCDIGKIKSIEQNCLEEKKTVTALKQSKTLKFNERFAIFNTNWDTQIERVLTRIHELLHVIYWEISDDVFEHERFVMEQELEFLLQCDRKWDDIKTVYLQKKLNNYLTYLAVCEYEKAVVERNLEMFQINFNYIVKNNLNGLVELLNANLDENKIFSKLPYLEAINENRQMLTLLVNEILKGDD